MTASLSLFEQEHAAREKYIYFICSVAGALVAYLAKDFKPTHPWTTQASLMVSTLGCLVGSFLFGIARIACYNQGLSINRHALTAREETANLVDGLTARIQNEQTGVAITIDKKTGKEYTTEEIRARIATTYETAEKYFARLNRWDNASKVLFVLCHVFLIAGFVLMILAKVII